MLLEKNGRQSSGKKTRHFEIRYYFIHDHIKRGNVRVEYCPTDLMVGDFHTKPLQGSAFRRFRAIILNLPHDGLLDPMADSQECVGTSTNPEYQSVHTSVSADDVLEDCSKPLNQDPSPWITVNRNKKRSLCKKSLFCRGK